MACGPFMRVDGSVTVAVRVIPKAPTSRIVGIVPDRDGTLVLKARIAAVPERGKANAALIELLAKTWKLPKTSFSIAFGAAGRRKVVRITGAPDEILKKIEPRTRTRQ